MTLIEALPKNEFGNIITPVGGYKNGEPIPGEVAPAWLESNFPDLASAEVPLSDADFQTLKAISQTWSDSADIWRAEGII